MSLKTKSFVFITFAVVIVVLLLCEKSFATITRVNSTPLATDASSLQTKITFETSDFAPSSIVSKVIPSISFAKVGDENCNTFDFSNIPYFGEMSFVLSHAGVSVQLIGFGTFNTGSPSDSSVFSITFDSSALFPTVSGLPQTGVFSPTNSLDAFNGLSPSGDWTLTVTDNGAGASLCFIEWRLTINCGSSQSFQYLTNPINTPVVIDNSNFEASINIGSTGLLGIITKVVVTVDYSKFSGNSCSGTGNPLLGQLSMSLRFTPSSIGSTSATVVLVAANSWSTTSAPPVGGGFSTTFDSASTNGYPTTWTQGTISPFGNLNTFNDYLPAGTWTLIVSDSATGAAVCLKSWRLTIDSCFGPCGTYTYTQSAIEGVAYSLSWNRGIGSQNLATTQLISWGDSTSDSSLTIAGSLVESFSHIYGSAGANLISFSSTVNGICRSAAVFTLNVANILPIINPPGFGSLQYSINQGTLLSLPNITFVDAGSSNTHTASMNWGDGQIISQQVIETPIGPPGVSGGMTGTVVIQPHSYFSNGNYNAVLTITDNSAGQATTSTIVSVSSRIFIGSIANLQAEVGVQISINPSWQDLTQESHTGSVQWGDNLTSVASIDPPSPALSGTLYAQHYYSSVGEYTGIASIQDPQSISATTFFSVVVYQPRPVLTIRRFPSNVRVAQVVPLPNCTFTGSPLQRYTATINWGDGTVENAQVVHFSSGGGVVFGQHTYSRAFFYDVQVQLTSVNQLYSASVASNVAVQNTAAILSKINPSTIFVYDLLSLNVSFSDAGRDKSYTATIDWGTANFGDTNSTTTANVILPSQIDGLGFIQSSHRYVVIGDQSVDRFGQISYAPFNGTLTLIDNFGAISIIKFQVTVIPGAIYVEAGQTLTVVQGQSFQFVANYTSTGSPSFLEAIIDWTDDTQVIQLTGSPGTITGTHVYYEAGIVVPVSVQVSDEYDQSGSDSTLVYVTNFAPQVQIEDSRVLGTIVVDQGTEYSISVIYFDSGIFDSHVAVVNWGDSSPLVYIDDLSPVESNGFSQFFRSYVFNDVGNFEVIVSVFDNSQASGTASLKVQVANVAPIVFAVEPITINGTRKFEGQIATFFDQGPDDTHTAVVDWGDGSTSAGFVSGPVVRGLHTYRTRGTYFAIVSVIDNYGGVGSAYLSISVV